MRFQDIKNKFEKVASQLPEEILSKGNIEQRTGSIGIVWNGGTLFFGENRSVGEFVLHVYDNGCGEEYYALYPVYRKKNQACDEEIVEIITDLKKYKPCLLNIK